MLSYRHRTCLLARGSVFRFPAEDLAMEWQLTLVQLQHPFDLSTAHYRYRIESIQPSQIRAASRATQIVILLRTPSKRTR